MDTAAPAAAPPAGAQANPYGAAVEELHRTHAMALRLVAQDRRWIVTVLEIG